VVVLLLLAAPVAFADEPPLPADTIARVQDRTILKADFEHQLAIANAMAGGGELPAPGSKDYKQLSEQVVQLLVSFEWIRGEARERGIFVSKAAVRAELRRLKRQSFPTERDYQAFLKSTGRTEADLLEQIHLDLLANRIRDRVIARAKTERGQQRVLDRWVKRFARKWHKRTVCAEPYAVADCGRVAPVAP
jgi:hypothetical protein